MTENSDLSTNLIPIKVSIMTVLLVLSLSCFELSRQISTKPISQPEVMVVQTNNNSLPVENEIKTASSSCYQSCLNDADCLQGLTCSALPCPKGQMCNQQTVCQKQECPLNQKCDCTGINTAKVADNVKIVLRFSDLTIWNEDKVSLFAINNIDTISGGSDNTGLLVLLGSGKVKNKTAVFNIDPTQLSRCQSGVDCELLIKTDTALAKVIKVKGSQMVTPAGSNKPVVLELTLKEMATGDIYPETANGTRLPNYYGDDAINSLDVAYLISQWGKTGKADLNSDGIVNGNDLKILLTNFGQKGFSLSGKP
jgi:hypothetical protein